MTFAGVDLTHQIEEHADMLFPARRRPSPESFELPVAHAACWCAILHDCLDPLRSVQRIDEVRDIAPGFAQGGKIAADHRRAAQQRFGYWHSESFREGGA